MRYLTRRYIGEYRSKTDLLYRQTISLDSGLLDVEIVDVSAETDNEFPIEQIQWADSCLIVYSITDRESFKYATRALGNLKSLQNGPSAYLIANKADLDHLREVSIASIIFIAFYFQFLLDFIYKWNKHKHTNKNGFLNSALEFVELNSMMLVFFNGLNVKKHENRI